MIGLRKGRPWHPLHTGKKAKKNMYELTPDGKKIYPALMTVNHMMDLDAPVLFQRYRVSSQRIASPAIPP
jgi:hypothetical protein